MHRLDFNLWSELTLVNSVWQVTGAEEVRNKKHEELKTQLDGAKSSILEAQTGRNYS